MACVSISHAKNKKEDIRYKNGWLVTLFSFPKTEYSFLKLIFDYNNVLECLQRFKISDGFS